MLIVLAIIIFGIAWWLISPFWRIIRMDEPFPETSQVSPPVVERRSSEKSVLAEAPLVASAHDVQGKVLLIQKGEQKILRFENLKTINGPDLRIYLSTDLKATDFVDLGAIKATEGNVNYVLPAGIDTEKYRNVLIWCRAFSVLFSSAKL